MWSCVFAFLINWTSLPAWDSIWSCCLYLRRPCRFNHLDSCGSWNIVIPCPNKIVVFFSQMVWPKMVMIPSTIHHPPSEQNPTCTASSLSLAPRWVLEQFGKNLGGFLLLGVGLHYDQLLETIGTSIGTMPWWSPGDPIIRSVKNGQT